MTPDVRCLQCAEKFPAHVVEQFGGMCPACVAGFAELPAPSEKLLKPGSTFGRYEILDILGRGGMGVVYRARQRDLDRTVALKVLSPRLAADRTFVERFGHEAKALARLSHPNIVAVHDCGVEEGTPYLAMEHVEGPSLRRLIAERRLKPEQALRIVPQLCDALEYAHGQGVIHRDIKPENILSDGQGRVKIADFGLAMLVGAGAPRLTQTNAVMGTPHYMAPEQVENPKTVDHRADIYSMGVVFYEMLTGELPIGAFSMPSEKAQVNRRVDEIVLRALAKEPARRYQRASEVKSDLDQAPRQRGVVRFPSHRFEWKTKASILGWPLIHVAMGQNERGLPIVAKGVIAVGNIAVGAIALGGVSLGLISLGGVALGLLFALGGLAVGGVALGGGSVGGVAIGGGAAGYYALGGGAYGRYVMASDRVDPEAQDFFPGWIQPALHDSYSEGMKAFRDKDYARAQTLLLMVPETDPRYTRAIVTTCYDIDTLALKSPERGLPLLNYVRQKRPNDPALEAALVKVMDAYQAKLKSKASRADAEDDREYHAMRGESKDFMTYIVESHMQRIEEALASAKTIRVKFKGLDTGQDGSAGGGRDYRGTLRVSGPYRASLIWDEPGSKETPHHRSVSDGKKTLYETDRILKTGDTSYCLRANLEYAISTTGFSFADQVARSMGVDSESKMADLRKVIRRSGLTVGRAQGAARSLAYFLTVEGSPAVEVEVWYDPSSYKILKRVIKNPSATGGGRLEETYEEVSFDETFPPGTFSLTQEGK